jgi:hypothetical protein
MRASSRTMMKRILRKPAAGMAKEVPKVEPISTAHAMSATTRLREEVSGIYDKHVLVKRWGLLYFVAFYTPYLIPRRLLHLIGPTTPISGYAECSHLLPPSPVFFSLPYIT